MKKILLILALVFSGVFAAKLTQAELESAIAGCKANNASDCRKAGGYYIGDLYTENLPLAYEYLSKGCNLKDGSSCAQIGLSNLFNKAIGNTMSKEEVLKTRIEYFKKGCEYNDAFACRRAGSESEAIAQDEANRSIKKELEREAEKFYRKACRLESRYCD
ncbi:hypothetical protein CCY99_06040 [Helicobacter sp. 16-1353]|uniref:hypothetical protein n=1 Tax=Helicobacter sp. 16-1353 TaxID=2004996 RepID=UPI000DCB90F4|nr:hypothetical protein [Helicobacter sp. 16-1353]RAX53150.1 hypothetical protein CCY99_06040 [Helicobacter sp. 16-1353]